MTEQQHTQTQSGPTPGPSQPGPTPGPSQPGPTPGPTGQRPAPPYRRLTRTSSWDAPISGVCGGVARYLGVDPTVVRVAAVIAVVLTFPAGLIAYAVMWAVIPKE